MGASLVTAIPAEDLACRFVSAKWRAKIVVLYLAAVGRSEGFLLRPPGFYLGDMLAGGRLRGPPQQ